MNDATLLCSAVHHSKASAELQRSTAASDSTLVNFEGDFRVAGSGVLLYANLHW